MNGLLILIPAALTLGGLGLLAFIWSLRGDQYEDLDGEAERILFDQPIAEARARRVGPVASQPQVGHGDAERRRDG